MWGLSSSDVLALAIFISYFSLILGLFALIWRSLPTRANTAAGYGSYNYRSLVFGLLTIGSFAHTWFCKSSLKVLVSSLITACQICSNSSM